MANVTEILTAIERGQRRAVDDLLPVVYEELRMLAARKLDAERVGHSLAATALVHEAYLRLVGGEGGSFESRGHFFAAAAEAMRRILIDNARRKKSLKRGGDRQRVDLDEAEGLVGGESRADELLALDEALKKLEDKDELKAKLVKLRYFAGMTTEQAAEMLGVSRATAERYWDYAKSWLRVEMDRGCEG